MDFNERFTAELNSKERTPRQMVSFLNGVIKTSEKQIGKLMGDAKTETVTFNSEDGPQPSNKKDDAKAKKRVVTKAKKLRAEAKKNVKPPSRVTRDKNTGELTTGGKRNASTGRKSKGARSSRGGGGGVQDITRSKMRRPSGGNPLAHGSLGTSKIF
tara:strand:- start:41 stop:511 length:471 start_codon:yes stop_codon:yes gene_type:complete